MNASPQATSLSRVGCKPTIRLALAFFWRVSRVVLVSFLYRMRLLD
jgi:hypothetical protein